MWLARHHQFAVRTPLVLHGAPPPREPLICSERLRMSPGKCNRRLRYGCGRGHPRPDRERDPDRGAYRRRMARRDRAGPDYAVVQPGGRARETDRWGGPPAVRVGADPLTARRSVRTPPPPRPPLAPREGGGCAAP